MGPAVVVLVLALTGCGGSEASSGPRPSGTASVSGTVTVLAAASLTGSFEQIAARFETAHPGTDVVLSFGASSALAQQVLSGAPADVFAAASPATMRTVTDAGQAPEPQVFARNRLQIAVPPDNPGKVTGLADLTKPALKIALCAPKVPCGAAAAEALEAAGLTPSVDTEEQDVKAALAKVTLGEVDAALVYRTDVLAAGTTVKGISFPEADEAVNDYPVAVLAEAPNPRGAAAFAAFVLSAEGQAVLAAAGFDRA
jgi:molybdate transport system substrate-binding protein